MKRALIFSFALLIAIAGKAQTLSSSLTSSGGTLLASSSLSITISIGQPIVGDIGTSSVLTSQGFLATTGEDVITAIHEKGTVLNVFPNPAVRHLFIQSDKDIRLLHVDLIDMSGKKVQVKQTSSEHSVELDLQDVAPALYLLRLRQSTGEIKTISIIKSNQ